MSHNSIPSRVQWPFTMEKCLTLPASLAPGMQDFPVEAPLHDPGEEACVIYPLFSSPLVPMFDDGCSRYKNPGTFTVYPEWWVKSCRN